MLTNLKSYGMYQLHVNNMQKTITTGVVLAANFANKVRRTVFAAFGNAVSTDEIVRAVAKLNVEIFSKMSAMGIDKLHPVRITVSASVKDGKLVFSEPVIEWFVPQGECVKWCKS